MKAKRLPFTVTKQELELLTAAMLLHASSNLEGEMKKIGTELWAKLNASLAIFSAAERTDR
jgi:hypothetical protein